MSSFQNSQSPLGLLTGEAINVRFSGSGTDYSSSNVAFFVFDSAQDAQSWFSTGLRPYNLGKPDTPTGNTVFPSGFSTDQQAQCRSYSQAAVPATPAQGVSACYVQWGDVVVEGITKNSLNVSSADMNMAVTLARSGLLSIAQAIAS